MSAAHEPASVLLARLGACLDDCLNPAHNALTIAVSGGVDSMTLATFAHRHVPGTTMVHATSAAVPPEATARVREWAAREGWPLQVVDAGEFADPRYRANPVNRCFFCKTNLYETIGRLAAGTVLSGANLDDLAEYRPGLEAAREHGVRHPFVEARVDKAGVRRLSAALGMGELAALPSSPCLSSRVETGIAIEPGTLVSLHAVERLLVEALAPRTVRCRVRAGGLVVELDGETLQRLEPAAREALAGRLRLAWSEAGDHAGDRAGESRGTHRGTPGGNPAGHAQAAPDIAREIRFAPYRNGSAFLVRAA